MVQNDKTFCLSHFISGTMHHQRIIQEFHLGISHEHHLVMRTLHLGCFGEGAMVSPLLLFSYITSRFAYMKHLFCWQFILIFLYLLQIMSADKLSFGLNVLLLYSSYCFPYFLLYENCSCWVWKLSIVASPLNLIPSAFFITQSDWLEKKADHFMSIIKISSKNLIFIDMVASQLAN